MSVRISPLRILCTPAGLDKGRLRPADLVVIDRHGEVIDGGEPSTEIKVHLMAYRIRPDCVAVVHAHPITATGFALAGEDIPDNVLPEAMMVLGSVATVLFAPTGSQELADAFEPLLPDHKTFLLRLHGALTLGSDLSDAVFRMETLERVARILLVAKIMGGASSIPESRFKAMAAQYLNGKL